MGERRSEARRDAPTRSRRCRRSCARRCAPARSASPAAPARRTTARAACRCPRAWPSDAEMRGAGRRHGRGRPRRLHADQGRAHADPVPRIARRGDRPAGDGRGAAAQQHQPDARCSPTSTRSPPRTRAVGGCSAQVSCCPLSMDFTLASPYPVEGLASWKPALGLAGAALEAVLADTAFRDGVRAELATPAHLSPLQRRMGQGAGGRGRAAGAAALRAAHDRRDRRERGRDPLDTLLDLALAEDLDTVFTAHAAQQRRGRGRPHAQPPAQPASA